MLIENFSEPLPGVSSASSIARTKRKVLMMRHVTLSHVVTALYYIVMEMVGSSDRVMLPIRVMLDAGSAYNVITRNVLPPTDNHKKCRTLPSQPG